MQVKKREAATIFQKLKIKEKSSTHHVAGWVIYNERKLFLVHYSKGRGDMVGYAGEKFCKSLKLTRNEFAQLKGCKMDRTEYLSRVVRR